MDSNSIVSMNVGPAERTRFLLAGILIIISP